MHPNAHKGAILLTALVFFSVTFALAAALMSYSVIYVGDVRASVLEAQAQALADAGLERAIIRVAQDAGYTGEVFELGNGEVEIALESEDADTKRVIATGYIPSRTDPLHMVSVQVDLEGGTGAIPFAYGVHAGEDGLSLSGGAEVVGNVYANGPINAVSGVRITGSATAAGTDGVIGGSNYTTGAYIGTGSAGDAWASSVRGITVAGILYCSAAQYTNKICNTSRSTPPLRDLPVQTADIDMWKAAAEAGGIIAGEYTVGYAGDVLGPRKIEGDLRVEGGGTLILTGPLWVTGDVSVSGGGSVRLAASKGSLSEVIVADGQIELSGGATLSGSGQDGSVLFFVSTNTNDAISLSGGAGSVGLVAPFGTVAISGGTSVKTVAAQGVTMQGGAQLIYDTSLSGVSFSDGVQDGWRLKRGTYRVVR